MSDQTALAGRIREYLAELQGVVNRVLQMHEKALLTGDDGYWDAVALNLHSYYTGVEHIFEDIARAVEGSLPSGPGWHLDLLVQMASEVFGQRPAVIRRETRLCLDDYRGFRHIVRNVYAFNIRPARLQELVTGLPECYNLVKGDLMAFTEFLEILDHAES
jgi:hypothetical protein